MAKKKNIKISKNAKNLIKKVNPNEKSPLENLFVRGKIRENLPAKFYIDNAKLIATGVKNKKDAMQLLIDAYELSSQHGIIQWTRPSVKNRKYYARHLGISKRFKYYPMPVPDGETKVKFSINKKNKTIVTKGIYHTKTLFLFEDRKLLASNPRAAVEKMLPSIEKTIKANNKKYFEMNLKNGEFEIKVSTNKHEDLSKQIDEITKQIIGFQEKYFGGYNENGEKMSDYKDWLMGFFLYTFDNQEENLPLHEQKKTRKKKKSKREKIRAK